MSAIAVLATAVSLSFAPAALAQSSPTSDGYGSVIAEVVTPSKTVPKTSSTPPAATAVTPAAAAPSNGSLPFTGLQVGAILFAGAALLGVGLVLRRFSSSS